MTKIIWELPLSTVSEANRSEHWTKSSKRHKLQQFFIRQLFLKEAEEIPVPCQITLIRLSPRLLDSEENLPMAFKWVKDEIGACIFPDKVVDYDIKRKAKGTNKVKIVHVKNKGHADDSPLIKWKYDQEKSKFLSIRIEIESLIADQLMNIAHE